VSSAISERLSHLQARIAAAAAAADRPAAAVRLIAVSKTHSAETVAAALAAGQRDFGENRVQEAQQKISSLGSAGSAARWHLIGHLQRNKARLAVQLFDVIHSVDSLRLAEALDQAAAQLGRRPQILLQVNVSGEASKDGFALAGGIANQAAYATFLNDVAAVAALPHLHISGLMTIAPIVDDAAAARPFFARMAELRNDLQRRFPQQDWSELSMGMSDDLEAAVAEGATMVRIGRALFGARE
jgi:PLP dependent protein